MAMKAKKKISNRYMSILLANYVIYLYGKPLIPYANSKINLPDNRLIIILLSILNILIYSLLKLLIDYSLLIVFW